MRKSAFCIAKTKAQISCAMTVHLISAFVFATKIVQSHFFLNPKFSASSHILWMYSPVRVVPGQKPQRQIFLQHGSDKSCMQHSMSYCLNFAYKVDLTSLWNSNLNYPKPGSSEFVNKILSQGIKAFSYYKRNIL